MKNERTRRWFRSGIASGISFLILCLPSTSLGWGAGGHMMTAQIAFKRLKPKAKAKAIELLALPINPASITKKSKDFVNASHWPDDLRPVQEFDPFLKRHFIDNPFSPDSTPLPAGMPEDDNIVKALADNVEILKTSTDKNAQAQALRFIIHFVGDIHQPLHAATRIDRKNADGDLGGNEFFVMLPDKNKPGKFKSVKLHSYWDGGINNFPPTRPNFVPPPLGEIAPAVALAVAQNPDTDSDLKLDEPFNFSGWADESFALAKDVAYDGLKNRSKPSAAYKRKALATARKRVAWGGYRLAALLNTIWPE
jgi:hypothetical protein